MHRQSPVAARVPAEAMLDKFERDAAEFSLSMAGRPEIRTGHLVNRATRFHVAGLWYFAEVHHVATAAGAPRA